MRSARRGPNLGHHIGGEEMTIAPPPLARKWSRREQAKINHILKIGFNYIQRLHIS